MLAALILFFIFVLEEKGMNLGNKPKWVTTN
jgi:hypothetical protein